MSSKVAQYSYSGTVSIPETAGGYTVGGIGNDAFYDCDDLIAITIPSSILSIGASVFYGCTSLTSTTIPDGVPNIDNYTFYGCTSLVSVVIPSSVTYFG